MTVRYVTTDGLRVCTDCGSAVGDTAKHDELHRERDELREFRRNHYLKLAAESAEQEQLTLEAEASRETNLAGAAAAKAALPGATDAERDHAEQTFGGGL